MPLLITLYAMIANAAGADSVLSAQRAEFQRAMAQVALASSLPGNDSAALRRYMLFPYVEAARLESALVAAAGNVPPALEQQVSSFIQARRAEPVAQKLRRSWLGSLATRGRWQEFLAFHDDASDGAALRCHAYSAQIESGSTQELAARTAQTWLTPRSLPECERAFAWLDAAGGLTPALVEQRVRLSLEAGNSGFARQIAARLPAAQAAPLLQWAALLDNPQREIDALIANPRTAVESAALLAGWTKLARANRAAARQRFERLMDTREMDRRAASPYALALALALSWDRDSQALRYFDKVEAADFDDTAREWQVRAALWSQDWKQAARGIALMSEASRATARWRYWAARAAAHDGDDALARRLYESILAEDNYYSSMAAARLNRTVTPNLQQLAPNAAQVAAMDGQPAFARSRELFATGLTDEARAEWYFAQQSVAPELRAQTIRVAARWGWYDQAVTVATSERVFNDYPLLYPRPYDAAVDAAAARSGLAVPLIYGVVRQESLYRADAVSSAGARGLMQLTADTARRTAIKWMLPAPTATSLFEPATNVALGAAHLKDLLDRFDGQLPLALAGYNAGPNAAQRWLPGENLESDIWIENIPYNETRSYVQRILWHTVVFSWLEKREPQDTRTWLESVSRG